MVRKKCHKKDYHHPSQKIFIISNTSLLLTTNRHLASIYKGGGGWGDLLKIKKIDILNTSQIFQNPNPREKGCDIVGGGGGE